MVAIPVLADPTLEAADRALEAISRRRPRRSYLGMSAIGNPCSRKLWYGLRATGAPQFDAATLKRFADGEASEVTMADRLRLVPGITLLTIDPESGRQYGFSDIDGQFKGHMDGAVLGLIQAPKTWHVWEHKCVNEKKFSELTRLKAQAERSALKQWDEIYYAQAVLYMSYSGMERHYLTVATPGTRSAMSVRSDGDPAYAEVLKDKARRILGASVPPTRVSNSPSWFQCRYCEHAETCHGE